MGFIKRLTLCFFLLKCLCIEAFPQQVPSYNFTTADGLPNNAIRGLLVDSRGILWIGTENGVSKFENGNFQNFYEEDGLGFNSCWAIEEDQEGNLWFGSYGGGVSVFDGKSFHVFTQEDGLTDNRIRRFYPYGDKMLIGTEDGVSIADVATLKITPIPTSRRENDLNYTTGFFESENRLFFTTYRSGTYELDLKGSTPMISKINDWLPVYSVFQKEKDLFLADKGSVKKVDLSDFLLGKSPKDSLGQSIVWQKLAGLKNEDYLLAASTFSKDGGVFLLQDGYLKNLNQWFGVDSKFILSGAVDKKRKLLFLGSQDKGLYQIRLDNTIVYEAFEETEVKGIAGNQQHVAFISSKGLEVRDSFGKKIIVPAASFKQRQKEFYSIFPKEIPKHLDGFFELDPSIPAEEIEFYELHQKGNSWWTNSNIGIFELNLQGKILTYHPVHAFSIGFTPEGKLLETNPYAGVRVYSDPSNFEYTYYEPELPNTPLQIAKVIKTENRTYLASVFHGLYHFEEDAFFSYKKEGIWEEPKFKTLHDLGNGQLVAGTEFGDLFKIRVEPNFEILRKWPKEELQGTSILFIESYRDVIFVGTELGLHILQGDEIRFWPERGVGFNRIYRTAKRIGEKLYVGLDQGIYILDLPDLIAREYPPVQLSITELKVNGKKTNTADFRWFVYQGEGLDLNSHENSLSIRFQPKNNFSEGKFRYRYRLKPEAEWTEFSEETLLELPYLPPGNYTLEVEAQDLFSGKMSKSTLLLFSISKPYYLQGWFIFLTGILLVVFILLIYKVRMSQVKSKSMLNQRLAEIKLEALQSQMNPHFIFNAINSIQYYILKKDTPQALEYLGKFSKLIRSTLDQSSKSQVSLEEETAYLKSYIEVENIRMDNRVKWEIKGNALDQKQDLLIPPMIIQPLVENVFNHAFAVDHPNPELTISYELLTRNQLLCIVKDNGTGIQQSNKTHESKGIKMIREKLSLFPSYTSESIIVNTSNQGYEVRVKIFCG
ncbi:MAG: histidine kinase [Algoriphagus sp.]|uniref:histidine kinase n=1 Tax=Algoriphagus sp. TaxID=1872435 RepID=UPI002639E5FE|nr:histidine kinase [Algoriphagus sp.]MDG1277130.1 histidine kinase [Algoriphagus sp.]